MCRILPDPAIDSRDSFTSPVILLLIPVAALDVDRVFREIDFFPFPVSLIAPVKQFAAAAGRFAHVADVSVFLRAFSGQHRAGRTDYLIRFQVPDKIAVLRSDVLRQDLSVNSHKPHLLLKTWTSLKGFSENRAAWTKTE